MAPYVRMVSSSSEAKASSIEKVLDVMVHRGFGLPTHFHNFFLFLKAVVVQIRRSLALVSHRYEDAYGFPRKSISN